MKKFLVSLLFVFSLIGCGKPSNVDYKNQLIQYNSSLEKYKTEAEMTISKEEGEIVFNLEVFYLSPNYYKVVMENKANNNIQVIVKNEEGVYVLTPALNKQFKFNSDWPLNSSHAYLYQSIVKDISNDPDSSFTTDKEEYTISSKVCHKTNANLKNQKASFHKKTNAPIKNVLYDATGAALVEVNFKSFEPTANLSQTDFQVDVINNTIRLEMAEGTMNGKVSECVPTFMPEGYELEKSVIQEQYTVFTYGKDSSTYTISCFVTEVAPVLTPTREFKDLVLLECGLGFVSDHSLSFYKENLLVTIYQTEFDIDEVMQIANSFK